MAKSYKAVAADLRASALAGFELNIKRYPDDEGMLDMLEDDYAHAEQVANYIELGEIEKAIDLLMYQDTDPREAQAAMLRVQSPGFYRMHLVLPGHAIA